MRILVSHVTGQTVHFTLQPFNSQQIGDMPCCYAADNLQYAAVLLAKELVMKRIQTNYRYHFIVTDNRYSNLAFYKFTHGAMEPTGLQLQVGSSNYLRLLGIGNIACQTAFFWPKLNTSHQKWRNIFLEPLLVFSSKNSAVLIFHSQPL